jgi:hypothetical protein
MRDVLYGVGLFFGLQALFFVGLIGMAAIERRSIRPAPARTRTVVPPAATAPEDVAPAA